MPDTGPTEALELAYQIAKIDEQRAALKAELDDLEQQRKPIEAQLLTMFQDRGAQNLRISGRTVYLQTERWLHVRDGAIERAVEAATNCGFRDAVNINSQRMSAHGREAGGLEKMPPEMQAAFEETVRTSIRSRRSG